MTSTPTGRQARSRPWLAVGAVATVIVVVVVLLASGGGTTQEPTKLPILHAERTGPNSMFTAGSVTIYTPQMLQALHALGVDSIHVYMHWTDMAPIAAGKAQARLRRQRSGRLCGLGLGAV